MEALFVTALANGLTVREKASGIEAKVIELRGELFLDEGAKSISPVSEFDEDDFELVHHAGTECY